MTKRFIISLLSILLAWLACEAFAGSGAVVVLADSEVSGASGTSKVVLDSLWNKANAAYYEGDFASAEALYTSVEESGRVSAKLYYNKAGTLFKMGKIGQSILYYSKAQRLAPADDDITHNLAIASTYTRNRIELVPEFFLKRWARGISSIMNGNDWALLSIVLFTLTLAGVLLYLLPLGQKARRGGFYGGLVTLMMFIFAFLFAWRNYMGTVNPAGGIITGTSASVKSSPDNAGKDLFLLYEGDRVEVRDVMGNWSEITVANGNRGWVRSGAISIID